MYTRPGYFFLFDMSMGSGRLKGWTVTQVLDREGRVNTLAFSGRSCKVTVLSPRGDTPST